MPNSFQGVLSQIPGLAGYLSAQQNDQTNQLGQIRQLGGLQGILAQQQQMQAAQAAQAQEQELRGILSQTGGDPQKAVAALLASGTPKGIQLAAALKGMMPAPPADYTLAPGSQRRGRNNELLAEAPMREQRPPNASNLARLMEERAALPAGDPRIVHYDNAIRKESETARQISPPTIVNNNPAPITPVTIADPSDAAKTIIVDGRLYRGGGIGSPGVIGPGPKMTQAGAADAKTNLAMQGLGADLQKAEDLLTGVTRTSDNQVVKGNLPTGSGLGALYDAAAGFAGLTPAGAAEADSLKTVAARLVGRIPRFEGPQSDKDVALYRQAAGDAGNEKLPRDRRLAAIRTMRELYAGYESGARGRILDGQQRRATDRPGGTPRVINFNDLPGG